MAYMYKTRDQKPEIPLSEPAQTVPNMMGATNPNGKPTYTGSFDDQLNDIFTRITNREPFQYDINADPLYQAEKDRFVQGGKLAMKDTMGQAAAARAMPRALS